MEGNWEEEEDNPREETFAQGLGRRVKGGEYYEIGEGTQRHENSLWETREIQRN